MYTPEDHADLALAHDLMAWSSELVNGILERRRLDLNMQALSFLNEAKRDADLGISQVDMADRYMQWKQEGKTA